MARKPAQTKTDPKAKDATAAEITKPADAVADQATDETGATENIDPTGGEAIHGAAPASGGAPAADGPGQGGGEAGSELPAAEDLQQAAIDTDSAANTHTEGGDKAGEIAGAPDHAPDGAVPGLGGEVGLDLPATNAAAEGEKPPVVPEGIQYVGVDLAASEVEWIVTCHRDGGRRRAGRRWPKGETPVKGGDLTAYDLATLQGDPQFSVRPAPKG